MIFDLDGTLIDSAADIAHAVNAMLGELGGEPLPESEVRAMIGDGMAKLVARALAARRCEQADPAAAQRSFLRHYESEPVRATVAYPGVRPALELLRAHAVLAVCTNKPAQLAAVILEKLQLAQYFSRIWGGDSLPFRKPDPRILRAILQTFDVAPEAAVMVGDSEVDAQAAHAAAVPLVLMTHGYRRGPAEHIRCLAALDDFAQLAAMVGSLP
jgi:phosphoglycolate phosphatase